MSDGSSPLLQGMVKNGLAGPCMQSCITEGQRSGQQLLEQQWISKYQIQSGLVSLAVSKTCLIGV